MPVVGNRIKVASSSTGTGNITLGSAEDGFQTFADGGISNNDVVRYVITEGSSFEIGKGTYLTSGPTLVRTSGNLLESSTGSLLDLGGSATVFVSLADVDVMQTDGGTFTGDVTFTGASYSAVWDKSANALEFADNAKVSFGTGSDLDLYHNGTNSFITNATGTLYIQQAANDADVRIRSDNGSGGFAEYITAEGATGEVQLHHYGSEKLATKSTGVDVTGNITVSGTVDGRDVATDGTKLDGIEVGANVGPSLAVAIALG